MLQRCGLKTKCDGATFSVNHQDFAGLIWLGNYEPIERFAVAKYIPKALPVIELGASIGVVSCLIANCLDEGVPQVVVEANPELISVLNGHRSFNKRNFEVVHAAVAYGTASVKFMIRRQHGVRLVGRGFIEFASSHGGDDIPKGNHGSIFR